MSPTIALVAVLGAVELGLIAALGWLPGLARFPLPGLAVFGAAFAAYVAAGWALARRGANAGTTASGERSVREVAVVWVGAVAMRAALLPLAPELSDDVWRYLWDGHVQLSGTNPYGFAPAAIELQPIRTAWHGLVNNPTVPTIYPPLAQLAFAAVALLGSSVLVAKVLWIACDLATAWVLARLARADGRNEALVLLLYLWAPLLVVEVAWSAHLEPLGLLAMVAAILFARSAGDSREAPPSTDTRGPAILAGVTLALAALVKLAPAAALPALARRLGWRPLAAFVATVAVLYLPYASAGPALFTGLRTYGEHWWFMKGPFALLELASGDPVRARQAAGAAVLLVVAWTALARFDLERALFWTLGSGMILTPTLHPWYVLWMLPLAALRGSRAWVLLGGLAFLGYFGLDGYRAGGEWAQPGALRATLWVPFLGLLTYDALAARARRLAREPAVR